MNNTNFQNALANVQLEGYEFTLEQIQFIKNLIERIDNKEISWDEAVKIIKERHNAKSDNNKSVSL